MKKLITAILIATMLFACMTVFVSADAAPAADDGSEYLLALWDFEDAENPFLDVVKGALMWARNGTDNTHTPECVEVKDGVAKVTAETNKLYLQYSQRVKTGYSGHENKTIFVKFYIDGTALNSDDSIIWHRSNDFSISIKQDSTNEKYAFTCKFFGTSFEIPEENTPAKPADKWYYVALTMETFDSATNKIPVNIYLSADGTNYQKTTQVIEIAADKVEKMIHPDTAPDQKATFSYFAFGKNNLGYDGKTTGVDTYFDEIRFYDVALSAEQIVHLKDKVEITTEEETLPEPPTRFSGDATSTPEIVTRAPGSSTTTEAAPSTEKGTETEVPGTTEAAEQKADGCKSVLTSGSLVLLLALGAGAAAVGKKHK